MSRAASRWHDSLASTPKWTPLEKAIERRGGRQWTARRPDTCDVCGDPIAVGESIWISKAPPCHQECVAGTGIEEYKETASQRTARELAADRRVREDMERQEADEALEARLLRDEEGGW